MALSTPGVASSDSRQAVTSPAPTTPMTTRSSPSMEWTLYPKSRMRSQTWSISWRVAWGRIEMIIYSLQDRMQVLLYTSGGGIGHSTDRKSTRLNSSHLGISYAVFCLKKTKKQMEPVHWGAPLVQHPRHTPTIAPT